MKKRHKEKYKCLTVVGARPQFIKAAPVSRMMNKFGIKEILVHTGQHYDYNMSRVFFHELGIKEPDYNLGVGSLSHGAQTGRMMEAIENLLKKEKPGMVLVYGDTNSTLAGALAAAKLHIPVAHVEAGLRSYNRDMPEEINRVLTDHVSDILFCPTETAVKNLRKEGFINIVNNGNLISESSAISNSLSLPSVINVGDVMYDSILFNIQLAQNKSRILGKLGLEDKKFYLATVHRAENTDDPVKVKRIFQAFGQIADKYPLIIPMHPRTKKYISDIKRFSAEIRIIPPVSYLDMLMLTSSARVILTDSGGVQKEAFFLKVPCVTLRDETEWVETLKNRMNEIAGTTEKRIIHAVEKQEALRVHKERKKYFGDGKASERIVNIISQDI